MVSKHDFGEQESGLLLDCETSRGFVASSSGKTVVNLQDCVDGNVGRFHQQFAEDLRHQGPYGAMGGGGWGDPCKASSAFSPLNTGVLPTSTGFNMASTPRGYPFYDPISFQRQSQVGSCNIQYVILYRVDAVVMGS